ncbi:hypothetical protein [Streptomyces sp. URMC 129]|uniref:hypothetical protein n=1 Tax=Streptomyces sp. URMC 129 TaxID=3423407 RepID=UPI003F1B7075
MSTHAVRPGTGDRCPTAVRRALMVVLLFGAALFLGLLFAGSAHAEESGGLLPDPVAVRDVPATPRPADATRTPQATDAAQTAPAPRATEAAETPPAPGTTDAAEAPQAPQAAPRTDPAPEPVPAQAPQAARSAADEPPAQAPRQVSDEARAARASGASSVAGLTGMADAAGSAPRALPPVVPGLTIALPSVRISLPHAPPPGWRGPAHNGGRAGDSGAGVAPGGHDRAAPADAGQQARPGGSGFGPPVPHTAPLPAPSPEAERPASVPPPPRATDGQDDAARGDGGPSPFPPRHHTKDLGRSLCDPTPRGVDQPPLLPVGHPLLSGTDESPSGPDCPLRDRAHGVLALPG